MCEVLSVYTVYSVCWDTTGNEETQPGRDKPIIRGLVGILQSTTSAYNAYYKGERGQPCLTPQDKRKKPDR